MLTINKTLQYIGLKGISFKGPAPIKENPSGLLNIDEAITLKLANILRYSNICCIAIDLNSNVALQLKELEITITKHNKTLMKIDSSLINWNQVTGSLLVIYRGLKANQWLSDKNPEIPKDIEDIINIKLSNKKNESVNSSGEKKYSNAFSPVKVSHENKSHSRKDSWESKNSESTVIEGKSIQEMSFGKSTLNRFLKDEGNLGKYLYSMNEKIQTLEQKFTMYSSKTDLYMEKIEGKLIKSNRSEDINSIGTVLKDIQSRLDKFEKDKITQEGVIEDYIQRLESLKFSKDALESSRRSSRRLRPQKNLKDSQKIKDQEDSKDFSELKSFEGTESFRSDSLKQRITHVEEKLQKLEQESVKIGKVKHKLKGTMVLFT